MQQPKKDIIRELHRMIERHGQFQIKVENLQKESFKKSNPLSDMLLESTKFMSTSIALLAALVLNEVRRDVLKEVRREPEAAAETDPEADRDFEEAHDWMDALEISATPAKVCRRCGTPKK